MQEEWVVFQTEGELDLRALTTFGLNVKPKTDNPIGRFGTGLKYAIAVLIRLGAKVRIYRPDGTITFDCLDAQFRGEDVQPLVAHFATNEPTTHLRELPFTLQLGSHWEMWQAFRELESNTRDEGGSTFVVHESSDILSSYPGLTRICVCHENFSGLAHARGKVFLDSSLKLLIESPHVHVYPGPSDHLYYRGIRVADLERPSLYTYNVMVELVLTEDRTVANMYYARYLIMCAIRNSSSEDIIRNILTSDERKHFEATLDFDSLAGQSDTFMSILLELFQSDAQCLSRAKAFMKGHLQRIGGNREVVIAMSVDEWKAVRKAIVSREAWDADAQALVSLIAKIDAETGPR